MALYFKLVEITDDEFEEGTGYGFDGPWCQSIDPVDGAVYIATRADMDRIEIEMDALECAFGVFDKDDEEELEDEL